MADTELTDSTVRRLRDVSKSAACLFELLLNEPREDGQAPLFSREEAFALTGHVIATMAGQMR